MKITSQTTALENLDRLKTRFATRVRGDYEHRAKSCGTCETPGACCLDAHFVNVHITRLEAIAIGKKLDELSDRKRNEVSQRIEQTIDTYGLTTDGNSFDKTYACPLFERGVGCLVHSHGKPLPCIAHACYENREDLPPDELLAEQEGLVEELNESVYRRPAIWLPLPVAIRSASKTPG